jgi:hypothetical protein
VTLEHLYERYQFQRWDSAVVQGGTVEMFEVVCVTVWEITQLLPFKLYDNLQGCTIQQGDW